ncbi:hypothetical protein KY285_027017 [Solanum tuberosum]|nr:hypothetical protein KY285_027017 [Solanum tuberosum]
MSLIKSKSGSSMKYLCAWGNDAASEVLTEARLLLVENYFQTPSSAWVLPWPSRIFGRAPFGADRSMKFASAATNTTADKL